MRWAPVTGLADRGRARPERHQLGDARECGAPPDNRPRLIHGVVDLGLCAGDEVSHDERGAEVETQAVEADDIEVDVAAR
mgnify:CR=1 FL=1